MNKLLILFAVALLPWCARGQAVTSFLTLDEAVAIGLTENPEILAAQNATRAAEGRILQAGRIPNLQAAIRWSEIPTDLNVAHADETEFELEQEIEFPAKRTYRIDVASVDLEITDLRLGSLTVAVSTRIKKAYYDLWFTHELIDNLQVQLRILTDFQQLVNSRFEAAAGHYLDVVRSKVEIARVLNELAEAKREFRLRQSQFRLLLGRREDFSFVLADSFGAPPPHVKADSVAEELYRNSIAVKIARRTLARQQALRNAAGSSFLPDFSFGVSYQRTAGQPPFNANNFSGVTTSTFGFRFGLSVPLWFWQEPRGQVKEAEANIRIAETELAATERRIRARIANALHAVAVADEQLRLFDNSLLADADDILKTGISQYRNNQIDALNLLDIYRTYRATKSEYLRALTNSLIARSDLDAAGDLIAD